MMALSAPDVSAGMGIFARLRNIGLAAIEGHGVKADFQN
jgi:hypothetical protein